ncbi:hypothetical protein BGW36DRAFT_423489 [Talaromyces proteolyticus]|uniref:Uncharacterized protein n=1 Tax=Talaromyces proteolyticus TaxID=1131652 RepID=A0AAD4L1K6_9EURO|nr:uncharacterized protein BGW36DRAFT_423489 [Talaromyces proteolyticus]KAH8703951.1 hypothetical protein BGW36DRAFT_423489 [Talaromyces proteolyticus]
MAISSSVRNIVLTGLLGATAVLAGGSAQVNYYTDAGCTQYQWSDAFSLGSYAGPGYSYSYQLEGTQSANVANCNDWTWCVCTFYDTNGNTLGEAQNAGSNCVHGDVASFYCYGRNAS